MPDIALRDVLAQLDMPNIELDELDGAAIVDAFVIFRYQNPEWEQPRMMYVGAKGMCEELRIGMVVSVLDRMRATCTANWQDDD